MPIPERTRDGVESPVDPHGWFSWINVSLGVWLIAAAFLFPNRTGTGVTEDVVAGSIVAICALWAALAFRPMMRLVASWCVALAGLWTCVAPFALGYERASAGIVNDVVAGLAILALGVGNIRARGRVVSYRVPGPPSRA